MNHRKNKGFTLIELLVVVAIIGLLSSITLASLQEARKKATDAKILAEYNQLKIALEIYYNENGRYPNPEAGNYCIGATVSACSIAGVPIASTLNSSLEYAEYAAMSDFDFVPDLDSPEPNTNLLAAPLFTYTPSVYQVGTNKGFIYQVPISGNTTPKIILATHETGVVNTTAGVWTLSDGSN